MTLVEDFLFHFKSGFCAKIVVLTILAVIGGVGYKSVGAKS